jgi:hypothetical protein
LPWARLSNQLAFVGKKHEAAMSSTDAKALHGDLIAGFAQARALIAFAPLCFFRRFQERLWRFRSASVRSFDAALLALSMAPSGTRQPSFGHVYFARVASFAAILDLRGGFVWRCLLVIAPRFTPNAVG